MDQLTSLEIVETGHENIYSSLHSLQILYLQIHLLANPKLTLGACVVIDQQNGEKFESPDEGEHVPSSPGAMLCVLSSYTVPMPFSWSLQSHVSCISVLYGGDFTV